MGREQGAHPDEFEALAAAATAGPSGEGPGDEFEAKVRQLEPTGSLAFGHVGGPVREFRGVGELPSRPQPVVVGVDSLPAKASLVELREGRNSPTSVAGGATPDFEAAKPALRMMRGASPSSFKRPAMGHDEAPEIDAFLKFLEDDESAAALQERHNAGVTQVMTPHSPLSGDYHLSQYPQHAPPYSFQLPPPWQEPGGAQRQQKQVPPHQPPRQHVALAPSPGIPAAAGGHYVYYQHSPGDVDGSQHIPSNAKPIYAFEVPPVGSAAEAAGFSMKKNSSEMMSKVVVPPLAYGGHHKRRLDSDPAYVPRYDFIPAAAGMGQPPHPIYHGNQILVPVVLGDDKRYAKSPVQVKPQAAPTPLDARTIPYLGKSKVSRLASLGVLTVEDLASVNPDDRLFAVAATKNNRSDHAKRTLQKWRDKALNYLMTKQH